MSARACRRAALACALAAAACLPAAGADIVAVLSSDSPHYRQAFEGFQEAWGSPVPHFMIDGDTPTARVVVAFGSKAALQDWPPETHLVACLAPAARAGRDGGILVVDILPEHLRLFDRIKTVLPRVRTIQILWTSTSQSADVEGLSEDAALAGLTVRAARLPSADALPEALRSIQGRADALFLMPDPVLVNATAFAILKEYSKAARIPFLAPTEGLAEKGATATFAAPFREIGRAAALALKSHLAGTESRPRVHSHVLTVTVSASAAADAGLDVEGLKGVDRIVP